MWFEQQNLVVSPNYEYIENCDIIHYYIDYSLLEIKSLYSYEQWDLYHFKLLKTKTDLRFIK